MSDLRDALRVPLLRPWSTLAIILTLALGIGANTAIFSLIDAVLLKTLPVVAPERLVLVERLAADGDTDDSLSYPLYRDFQQYAEGLDGIAAHSPLALSFSDGGPGADGTTERVQGELVSGSYFETLGVGAAIGRVLTPEDDRVPGGHAVAVLSHGFWTRRFGGDPGAIGRTIRLNGHPYTVIGVTPPEFFGLRVGAVPDVRVPMMMEPATAPGNKADNLSNRRRSWLQIVARLAPGVDPRRAGASLSAVMRRALEDEAAAFMRRDPGFAQYRDEFLSERIELAPGSRGLSTLRARFSMPLRVLMAMVAAVLLIACANVASLLLVRAVERRREMAIRVALGASRLRLLRLMAAETLVIAVPAAVLGLLVASWARDALIAFLATRTDLRLSAGLDARLLVFTSLVSIGTALLFGLLPSLQAMRVRVAPGLKAGPLLGLYDVASRGRWRRMLSAQRLLVIAQVALTLVLLVGAGLFVRTLSQLRGLDAGMRPDRVLLADIDPDARGYTGARLAAFYETLQRELARVPGVRRAALASVAVLGGGGQRNTISVPGYLPAPGEDMNASGNRVTPGYLSTMGMTLRRGRDITARDGADSPRVAVINERMAQRFFGGRDPVGQSFFFGSAEQGERLEIIGVVGDASYRTLRERVPPMTFTPLAQDPPRRVTLHVQVAGADADANAAAARLARVVRSLDADLPLYHLRTFEQQVDGALTQERLLAVLAGAFGLVALALAVMGLFGVLASAVAARTRELGVRLALGAAPARLRWFVLRDDLLMVILGLAIGLGASLMLSRLFDSLLFGVVAHDWPTRILAVATVLVSAAAAGAIPARRASRVDPVRALRVE